MEEDNKGLILLSAFLHFVGESKPQTFFGLQQFNRILHSGWTNGLYRLFPGYKGVNAEPLPSADEWLPTGSYGYNGVERLPTRPWVAESYGLQTGPGQFVHDSRSEWT